MDNRTKAEETHNRVSLQSNIENRIKTIEDALDAATQEAVEREERLMKELESAAREMEACAERLDAAVVDIRESTGKK